MESPTIALFSSGKNHRQFEKIVERPGEIIRFPPPEFGKGDFKPQILNDLSDFDWLIIADPVTADIFVNRLEENDFDLFELDRLRICVGGETTADRLRFRQIHSDVIPSASFSAEIFAALRDYIDDETEWENLRFLFPRTVELNLNLGERIRRKKSEIIELPLTAVEFAGANPAKLKSLLLGGAIDEFYFSAPEEIFYLRQLLRTEKVAPFLDEVKITAADDPTRQSLRENGVLI